MRTHVPSKRSGSIRPSPLVDALEPRRLFAATLDIGPGGALTYTGSSVDNNLKVSNFVTVYSFNESGESITLTPAAIEAGAFLHPDSGVVSVPNDSVNSILINTVGGDDTVNVNSIDDPTTVNTSVGDGDLITVGVGPSGGSTNAIDGDLTLVDTGGKGSVFIDDISSPPKTVNINDNVISGLAINGHTVTFGAGITSLTMDVAYGSTTNVNITSTPILQTLNINGSTFNGSNSDENVNVLATPASLTTNINTLGGYPDNIVIGNGTTSNVLGAVNVADYFGANLIIDDSTSGLARNVAIDNGTITGAAPGVITYGAGVINLTVNLSGGNDTLSFTEDADSDLVAAVFNGGDGGDVFTVTPAAKTLVTVNGGNPGTPTANGDHLLLNLAGATEPLLTLATSDSGTWTFADRETITFAGIESYDPTNVRAMVEDAGLGNGHTTALLAKLNLKGDSSDAGRLNAFIEQVANLVARGELTAAQGTALTQAANLLLLSIPA